MNTTVVVDVRPVEEADADSLGRVHAACWHETYDHLLTAAALSKLRPERLAAMWHGITARGPQYRQVVALVDGDIIGFAGSAPTHDTDQPAGTRELTVMYLLQAYQAPAPASGCSTPSSTRAPRFSGLPPTTPVPTPSTLATATSPTATKRLKRCSASSCTRYVWFASRPRHTPRKLG
ncbi:GNAT family N-acetyltransferase [Cryobacterium sp. MLB-32]|uniref:GNAT family N-acetyltransferase n=1 Tax=Cryobacterium sp. MLB-32 TaxID=1529318 RepID=UPI001E2D3621|nr:hypothetical protein [Cryobacterium sp. MLB-32]